MSSPRGFGSCCRESHARTRLASSHERPDGRKAMSRRGAKMASIGAASAPQPVVPIVKAQLSAESNMDVPAKRKFSSAKEEFAFLREQLKSMEKELQKRLGKAELTRSDLPPAHVVWR